MHFAWLNLIYKIEFMFLWQIIFTFLYNIFLKKENNNVYKCWNMGIYIVYKL